ncbi:MAG: class I SAM-dependent methyltransferase [Polyangiales bacterium]
MPDGATSVTAYVVTACLDKLARMPAFAPHLDPEWQRLNRLLADEAADSAVKRAVRWAPPGVARVLLDRAFVPGMMPHYLHRKRLIRREVERAIAGGATQVVVLGGGLDTLVWRLAPAHPSVCFVEVDLPGTQAAKLAVLRRAGVQPANGHYASADLSREGLGAVLDGVSGFDAHAPTLVVIEGVLMYLSKAAVESLFASLRGHLPGALSVVFGATAASDDAGTWSLRLVNALLRAQREGTQWHCPGRDMPAFLAALGFELEAWASYRALQAPFTDPARLARIPAEDENYYRARASRGTPVAPRSIDDVPVLALA